MTARPGVETKYIGNKLARQRKASTAQENQLRSPPPHDEKAQKRVMIVSAVDWLNDRTG